MTLDNTFFKKKKKPASKVQKSEVLNLHNFTYSLLYAFKFFSWVSKKWLFISLFNFSDCSLKCWHFMCRLYFLCVLFSLHQDVSLQVLANAVRLHWLWNTLCRMLPKATEPAKQAWPTEPSQDLFKLKVCDRGCEAAEEKSISSSAFVWGSQKSPANFCRKLFANFKSNIRKVADVRVQSCLHQVQCERVLIRVQPLPTLFVAGASTAWQMLLS